MDCITDRHTHTHTHHGGEGLGDRREGVCGFHHALEVLKGIRAQIVLFVKGKVLAFAQNHLSDINTVNLNNRKAVHM